MSRLARDSSDEARDRTGSSAGGLAGAVRRHVPHGYPSGRSLARGGLGALLFVVSACGSGRISLPQGPGEPFPAFAETLTETQIRCRSVRALTAELSLSGHARDTRLRGRILAGLVAPDALRLEGVAPFGPPAFILTARSGVATLLLPRDGRVVSGVPSADILEALAGVRLSPGEMRDVLTGCGPADATPIGGLAYGDRWVVVRTAGGDAIYLESVEGERRVRAVSRASLHAEYGEFRAGLPRRVRLVVGAGAAIPEVDLSLRLSQVRLNPDVNPLAFQADIPLESVPMSLEELRRGGPLGSAG